MGGRGPGECARVQVAQCGCAASLLFQRAEYLGLLGEKKSLVCVTCVRLLISCHVVSPHGQPLPVLRQAHRGWEGKCGAVQLVKGTLSLLRYPVSALQTQTPSLLFCQ